MSLRTQVAKRISPRVGLFIRPTGAGLLIVPRAPKTLWFDEWGSPRSAQPYISRLFCERVTVAVKSDEIRYRQDPTDLTVLTNRARSRHDGDNHSSPHGPGGWPTKSKAIAGTP